MIFRLVRAYIADSPWPFFLATLLCTLAIASAVGVLWLQSTLNAHAARQAEGIDLVVGAKGSGLQSTLAAVYHADVPNGNIALAEVEKLSQHPMVARAVPISLGDSVGGVRIVGAAASFFELYGAKPASGTLPAQSLEAVVGATAAKRLKLKVGDHFIGNHGFSSATDSDPGKDGAADAGGHAEFPYTLVGILVPTGRVIDELVITPLESVWAVHAGHTAATEPEVTFALLTLKSPVAMATLPRMINSQTNMHAASPSMESARLLANFGWVALIIKTFAVALIVSAMIATFAALSQAIERRAIDFALFRAMGVPRARAISLLITEALLIVTLAALLAFGLVFIGATWLSSAALPGMQINLRDGAVLMLAATAGAAILALVASLPTLKRVLSLDVATQLSRT